jgi:YgiT-type zinc finger domain-containing protein
MKCKECGKGTISRRKITDELEVGSTITLKVPGIEVEQCDSCDERYIVMSRT